MAALSKVCHRHWHLVFLLVHSIEDSERLSGYEYMSWGALSRHLFHWKTLKLQPLPWTRRLTIAIVVTRAMEYLRSLARQTFRHRDLSSNIFLDGKFQAKVFDFGWVKLAPDGRRSVVTMLAGTLEFGYLAPESAVMGTLTTKADVYGYETLERCSEESRHLIVLFFGESNEAKRSL